MERVKEYLQELEKNMVQLVVDYQKIKKERDHLINQAVIYQKTAEEQRTEINNLKSQVRALQIAKSVESSEETGKVKDKIQDLVREIDRCIELLNK